MILFEKTYNTIRYALGSPPASTLIEECQEQHNSSNCHQVLLLEDTLNLIFQHLTRMDLLRCSSVCQTWHYIIMNGPNFWKNIAHRYKLIEHETLQNLIRRRNLPEYSVKTFGRNQFVLGDKLELLMYSPNLQFMQKLSFSNIHVNEQCGERIAQALQLTSALKRIEFINCAFYERKSVTRILLNLFQNPNNRATITHISFYQRKNDSETGFFTPNFYEYIFTPINNDIPKCYHDNNIMYLKLAGPNPMGYTRSNPPPPLTSSISATRYQSLLLGAFQKFPNLVHLFLDANLLIVNSSMILNEAVKHCPRLVNLIASENGVLPKTMYLFNDDVLEKEEDITTATRSNYNIPSSTTQRLQRSKEKQKEKGLRRLVLAKDIVHFANKSMVLGRDTNSALFDKVYASLELLYLQCELKSGPCYKIFHNELSHRYASWPRLREIYIAFNIFTDSTKTVYGRTTTPVTTVTQQIQQKHQKALANLFERCHALEAITIDNCNAAAGTYQLVQVDDKILKVIAINCPKLRYFRVLDHACHHTAKGILNFATVGAFHLTDLEIDMTDQQVALQVAIKIKSLRQLKIRSYGNNSDMNTSNNKEKSMTEQNAAAGSIQGVLDNFELANLKAIKFLLETRQEGVL